MSRLNTTQWGSFQAPSGLDAVTSGVQSVTNGADQLLNLVEQIARVADALSAFSLTPLDPVAAVLGQSIKVLEAAIADISKPTAGHILAVPMVTALETGTLEAPPLSGAQTAGVVSGMIDRNIDAGNRALFNKIAASMHDSYDPNRPQFLTDAHIAGSIALIGVNHLTDSDELLAFAESSRKLIKYMGPEKAAGDPPPLPLKPRNVRTKIITKPPSSSEKDGAIGYLFNHSNSSEDSTLALEISWDSIKPVTTLGWALNVTARETWALEAPPIPGAQDKQRLNFTRKPKYVHLIKSEEPLSEPIFEVEGLDLKAPYIDALVRNPQKPSIVDVDIKPDTLYYYALAIEYEPVDSKPLPVEYTKLFTVYIPPEERAIRDTNQANPPNWISVSDSAKSFTHSASLIATISAYLDNIKKSVSTPDTTTHKKLEAILKVINQYRRLGQHISNEISAYSSRLTSLSTLAGIHIMGFAGRGNNNSILQAISSGLQDYKTDPAAPLYGPGSALACVVKVTGFRTAAEMQNFARLTGLMPSGAEAQPLAQEMSKLREMVADLAPTETEPGTIVKAVATTLESEKDRLKLC